MGGGGREYTLSVHELVTSWGMAQYSGLASEGGRGTKHTGYSQFEKIWKLVFLIAILTYLYTDSGSYVNADCKVENKYALLYSMYCTY